MKRSLKYSVAIVLFAVPIVQKAAAIELTQNEQEQLANGEVIVYLKAVRGPIKEGTAMGVVEAPPEKVFRVVTDK